MKPDVVTIGEVMGTLRFSGQFGVGTTVTPSLAGAEGNVAIGLARLEHAVAWVGSVGNDTFGQGIIKTLRGEGVDVSHVVKRPESTGLLVSRVIGPETKSVDYHRSGSAGRIISQEQISGAIAKGPRILHVTGITPALGKAAAESIRFAVDAAREAGITVAFDINFRGRLWGRDEAAPVLTELASLADIVIGGTGELAMVTGQHDPLEAMSTVLASGAREIVWKESDLARVLSAEGMVECPNRLVRAVDPIGAGDAFVSGYLSGVLDGLGAMERLTRAHLLGRIIVGSEGDWEGLPTREQLAVLEAQDGVPVTGSVVR